MAVEEYNFKFEIPLLQSIVWKSLLDADIVAKCIEGCEQLTADTDNRYRFTIFYSIGPFKRKMKGTLMLTDIKPMSSFHFRRGSYDEYEGAGAFRGMFKLDPSDTGTLVQIVTQVEMSSLIATLQQYFSPKKIEALSQNTAAVFTEEAKKKYSDTMSSDMPKTMI